MDRARFEEVAAEEFARVPERFAKRLDNVALLIEEVGSGTLLGLYHGVPATERGEGYGNLGTMPDTITLFYRPLLTEAQMMAHERNLPLDEAVRVAIRETLWHEIGHQFGLGEGTVEGREEEGTNHFSP